MKQKFLLKTMLLLLCMIVGTSSTWATDVTYDFTAINGFSNWSTAYSKHEVEYNEAIVTFNSANRQTSTITNQPVTKGQQVTIVMKNDNTLSGVAFVCTQWGTKAQTITLHYSKDGGANYTSTGVTSTNFKISSNTLPSGTNAVKITFSSTTNQVGITSASITYSNSSGGSTTAAPTISGDTPFVGSTTVTITNAASADGADIYYTLNGDDPTTTTSETCFAYSAPFSIDATTTVKAIAKKSTDTNASSVVSKTFTKITPLANIAALTANTETNTYYVTLTDAVVTYVSGSYAYIQDASGAVALYKSDHGFTAGDVLNGTATISYQLRNNNPQITDISGVTPVSGSAPAPTAVAQSAWAYTFSDVLSQYFKITGATITKSGSKYYVSLGGEDIQLYKNGGSISSLDLDEKYNITGFPTLFNSTKEIQIFEDPEVVTTPALSADPATAQAFTYIVDNGPSANQEFTITGTNLVSEDITATVSSEYEITDDTDYSSSVTIASGDRVSVRLKAGLAKGEHNGTLTLSSTDATDVVINLSGTVTGQTYTISVDDNVTGGSIEADLTSAEEGVTVTLTATPDAAYTFGSWTVYKDDMSTEVTVTDNQFTMPDCEVYVTATFTAKPTYAITCVANPVAGGTLEATPASAYEGQTVTLSYLAETGYSLSSIVITKTEDGSATGITPTVSGDDFTFTMPGYAVTATATFESNIFEGSFAKVTSISALEDGAYYVLYDTKAMNSTVTSGNMGAVDVTIKNNIIENPDRSIVWKLVKNGDDWDLYSEKEGKYCYIEGTNTSAFKMAPTASYHYAVTTYTDGGFKFKTTHTSGRGINIRSDNFGSYADSNNPKINLYKYKTLTERTITFNGNGGTYNEATTYTQDVYDGIDAKLDANKFTRDGYEFVAWNNQADGEGISSYVDGAKITVTGSDLTLYAHWAPLYTLTIDDNIEGGSVAIEGNVPSAIEDAEIELSYTPNAGHKFSAWNVYKEGDTSTKVTVTDNKFAMPNYNVVISATFEEVQTYSLVTDVNDIVPGKHYIIASGTNGSVKAMGNQNTNYRNVVSVTASNGIIPETDGVFEFVIYGPNADGNYTIYDAKYNSNAGGYLYANSSSSNNMGTQDSNDANGKWSIEIANTGSATINAQGTNTRNCMRFNGDRFSCYASTTSVSALPYLFVKDGDTPVATTASVKLNAYGYATFASTDALDFLDADAAGIEYSAWQITGISGDAITFSQIKSTVAAGEGILLKGTPNATINLNVLPIGGETLGDNKLEGITTATAIVADTYYGLKGNTFVKVNAGTIPAGKALLPASEIPSGARELNFVFEGEQTTSISEECRVKSEEFTTATIFDLQGRKVTKPQKGLYIVNGRKVVVK